MRRVLEFLVVSAVLVGSAFGAQEQSGGKVLVLDVYSPKMASDVFQEKGFAFWIQALKQGRESAETYYTKVIHAEYPLAGAFDIAKEAKAEGDEEKVRWPVGRSRQGRRTRLKSHIFSARTAACV
jgi:hypothetical protein